MRLSISHCKLDREVKKYEYEYDGTKRKESRPIITRSNKKKVGLRPKYKESFARAWSDLIHSPRQPHHDGLVIVCRSAFSCRSRGYVCPVYIYIYIYEFLMLQKRDWETVG